MAIDGLDQEAPQVISNGFLNPHRNAFVKFSLPRAPRIPEEDLRPPALGRRLSEQLCCNSCVTLFNASRLRLLRIHLHRARHISKV